MGSRVPSVEQDVRACLAAYAVTLPGGVVASEYVGVAPLSYVVPVVVGALCAAGVARAARQAEAVRVGLVAGAYAVLGVALGFRLEGSAAPVSGARDVLLAYAGAVLGAVAWAALSGPQRPPG